MIAVVASTPTSAVSRRVSSSSSRSSSMAFLPRNRLAMPSPMLALVFDRPWRRRAKKPSLAGASGVAATTGADNGSGSGSGSGYRLWQRRLDHLGRLQIGLDGVRLLVLRRGGRRFDIRHGLLDRFAVRLRLGGGLLCRSGLGLLAQPAEQAFLLAGLGRRLLVVVGTKHGEGILRMRNAGSQAAGLKMGPILAPRQAGALSAALRPSRLYGYPGFA